METQAVLYDILATLPQDTICTLHRAAKVCKLWRNITLKCRPWTPAFTAVFRTTGSEGHEAMRNLLSINGQKELQIERMEMSCVYFKGYNEKIHISNFHNQEFICSITNKPSLWSNTVNVEQPSHYWTAKVTVKVNLYELEKMRANKSIVEDKLIMYALQIARQNSLDQLNFGPQSKLGVVKPVGVFPKLEQPAGFKECLKLHNYQIAALSWMFHFEKNPAFRDTSTYLAWRSHSCTTVMDSETSSWVEFPLRGVTRHSKGAILADDMGLGKTMIVIGLILANQVSFIDLSSIVNVVATEKITGLRAEAAEYKQVFLDFVDDTKAKKPTKGKKGKKGRKVKKVEENNSEEYEKVDVSHQLYPTKASLVLCPSHLVKQWQDEITKSTDGKLSVISLTTLVELKKTTYEQVIDSDVVVVSYQLLKNPIYFHIGHITPASTVRVHEENRRPNWVKRYLDELRREVNGGIDNVAPLLDHFLFQRIILDEETILGYTSRFGYWLVSGTPFQNWKQIYSILKLFNLPKCISEAYQKANLSQDDPSLLILMKDHLIWRNTRQGLESEYLKLHKILEKVEEVKWLSFTPFEQHVYDCATSHHLPLCCYMGPYSLTWHWSSRIADLKVAIIQKMRDTKIQALIIEKKQLQDPIDAFTADSYLSICSLISNYIARDQHQFNLEGEKLASTCRTYGYYKAKKPKSGVLSLMDLFTSVSDNAAFESIKSLGDLDDLRKSFVDVGDSETRGEEKDDKAEEVTTDEETEGQNTKEKADPKRKRSDPEEPGVKKSKVDPQLPTVVQSPLSEEETKRVEIPKISGTAEPAPTEPRTPELQPDTLDEEALAFLVESCGTKLGNLLFYLHGLWLKDPTARVLIFSKYSKYLDFIGTTLRKCGITCGQVKGHVVRRVKAITNFKSEELKIRVLLLAYDTAASGANLIEASHVILMDPSTNTDEMQAICRAQRQGQRKNVVVVRFMIENSAEHAYYKEHNDTEHAGVIIPAVVQPYPKLKRSSSLLHFMQEFERYPNIMNEIFESD